MSMQRVAVTVDDEFRRREGRDILVMAILEWSGSLAPHHRQAEFDLWPTDSAGC